MPRKKIEQITCPRCDGPVVIIKETFTASVSLDEADRRKIDSIVKEFGQTLSENTDLPQMASYETAPGRVARIRQAGIDALTELLRPVLERNIKIAPVRPRQVCIHLDEQTTDQKTMATGSPAHVRRLRAACAESCTNPPTDKWVAAGLPPDVTQTSAAHKAL